MNQPWRCYLWGPLDNLPETDPPPVADPSRDWHLPDAEEWREVMAVKRAIEAALPKLVPSE
jgi:hypothetical protein